MKLEDFFLVSVMIPFIISVVIFAIFQEHSTVASSSTNMLDGVPSYVTTFEDKDNGVLCYILWDKSISCVKVNE